MFISIEKSFINPSVLMLFFGEFIKNMHQLTKTQKNESEPG